MSDIRPLFAVVVSHDESLLHQISWMLDAVGYKVQTATDLDQDALWRRYAVADFVIVDGRGMADPPAATFAHDSDNPLYRIFLYDPAAETDFAAWFAAGAHDALGVPVSRGELLTRIRTGARYLEFERRLQVQSSRGPVPGMYSRRGFMRKLRKLAGGDEQGVSQHAMLVTSIDWFAGISRRTGETASRSLLSTAARAIKRAVGENSVSAYLGDGQFAALLVGQSAASAKSIAESLAKDFGSRESHHESIPRPTLTCAVVPWLAGANADRFLSDALETLQLAEHSGGDRVLEYGEFNKEFAEWSKEMAAGNPFASVVAQDIMEPFAAVLEQHAEHGDQRDMAGALRRSGVPVRPYVDRQGRLVGVAADDGGETVTMPETIPHNASFPEIYDAFSSRGCGTLVVLAGEQPLGYLTCEGFLSMIDPIDADSFAAVDKSTDNLAALIVPSALGETAEAAAV